jgi:DNA-directed RNA polymerase specialized sigma24 family protein
MNDPQNASAARLVSALRADEPGALADLFDAYADRLFRYCWFMLRNADLAQIALRDTLIVAQAHIGRLADPEKLDSWLYSLARAECRRRRPVSPAEADEPPARPSQPDADSRLMAWNAVTSMDADAMEVLELFCRHDIDLGMVLGLPSHQVRGLLDDARQDLEGALGAEILVSRGSHACPDRAAVMHGWTGTVTPELRARVLQHAVGCPVCGPNLPRNVSATRVFELLPVRPLPSGARERVLDFCADPKMAAYREFAVDRAAGPAPAGPAPARLGPTGPGVGSRHEGAGRSAPRGRALVFPPRVRALVAVGAATAVAAVAVALVLAGQGNQARNPGLGTATSAGRSPVPRSAGAGAEGAVPIRSPTVVSRSSPHARASASELLFDKVTQPLASDTLVNPPISPPRIPVRPLPARSPSPSPSVTQPKADGALQVAPGTLALGASSQGELTITAVGAAQTWSASTPSGLVQLGASGGTLPPGQSITLTVGIRRNDGAAGSATIFIDQGTAAAQTVQVSWSGLTAKAGQPRPKPSPSPSPPSASPPPSYSSPSPSPSPSNSSGSAEALR